ncbi:glycosyltransferase [Formosa sp. 4Alg 33]|uniref:glycosyltransferase n=1 Tax=Formosa sp. 4Alg 33 TaxID=3382189 RepID=UPI003D9C482B
MKNKIKIAHILHSVGGVDVSLRLILENINSDNFESIVIHGEDDSDTKFKTNLGEVITDYKVPLQRNISPIKDLKTVFKTIKILRDYKPDIIHGHSAKGGIISKIVGKYLGVSVLHTPQAYSYLSASNKIKKGVFLAIEKMFNFKGNKILASSNSEKNNALKDVCYPKNRVLTFNNSILPIEHIKNLGIKKTWPDSYICSVGRPSYQKNIELMLEVISQVKKLKSDIHLVLMGVGYHSPNLSNVKSIIKALNLEQNITLLDWTTREDIFNIIDNSDLYITTARYEGLPYSVIESLALGKPIVATNADGNRDLVINGYNGILVDNENVTEFSAGILNLLNNKEVLESFSKNSKQLFEEKFNINNNIKHLENIYVNNI